MERMGLDYMNFRLKSLFLSYYSSRSVVGTGNIPVFKRMKTHTGDKPGNA